MGYQLKSSLGSLIGGFVGFGDVKLITFQGEQLVLAQTWNERDNNEVRSCWVMEELSVSDVRRDSPLESTTRDQ